jgi:hypothetical protein
MPCRQRRAPIEFAWRLYASRRRIASPFRRPSRPASEGELIGKEWRYEAVSVRGRPEERARETRGTMDTGVDCRSLVFPIYLNGSGDKVPQQPFHHHR